MNICYSYGQKNTILNKMYKKYRIDLKYIYYTNYVIIMNSSTYNIICKVYQKVQNCWQYILKYL